MQRRLLAALVLFVLAFGLLGGAHPCGGGAAKETVAQAAPAPSCHGMKTDAHESSKPAGDRHPSGGCDTSCPHACHMPAIASAPAVAFVAATVARLFAESADPGLPLLAPGIDHVPLV